MNILRINLLAIALTVLMVATAQAQTWFTNGLLAYYPFNGNANDASGRGNHGVVDGATLARDRFGVSNSCYMFDGISNRILATITGIPTNAQDRTLILWCKLTGSTSTTSFYVPAAWGSNSNNRAFGMLAASLPKVWHVQFWGGGQDISSTQAADNEWHQIACILETNTAKLYYDGVLKRTASKVTSTGLSQLCIGTGVETFIGGGTSFPGAVDDVRVYNRALSSNEIALLYWYESQRQVEIVKAYTLDFRNLNIGTNYQLQVSTNLTTWANWGSPFTATSDRYTNSIPFQRVDDWTKLFFRLVP